MPLDAETVAIRAYLLEQYPTDILAPLAPVWGLKYALLHRPGAWSWALSDAYVQSVKRVGIFLDSLCVIETASGAASDQLESMHPVLKSAPADVDTTSGGKHYFLACSERVRSEGFVERSRRPPQISRFLLIGDLVELPSKTESGDGGKRAWVRHLTKGRAPVIPDALLFDAAQPRHLVEPFVVSFFDGTQQSYPNGAKGLRDLGYFDSAIEGRWGVSTGAGTGAAGGGGSESDARLVLRVPAEATTSPALFDELLFVLAEGELSLRQAPTPELVIALAAAARYLSAPLSVLELLSTSPLSRVHEQVDLYDISPSFSLCVAAEAKARREGGVTEALLIPIDAEEARTLLYKPILKDSRCLLPDAEAPSSEVQNNEDGVAAFLELGEPVLESDPSRALKEALPRAVLDILSRYKRNIILAGGAVTGGVFSGGLKFSDCDLFIHGVEEDGANTIVDSIEREFAATYDIARRIQAVTFTPKDGGPLQDTPPFQLILSLFHNRAEVIAGFDLAPCKVLARVIDGELIIEALPAWRESLRRLAFWADSGCWSSSAHPRIYKYLGRGFDCFVPGTQRTLFVDKLPGAETYSVEALTWGGLFNSEKKLQYWRRSYHEKWRVSMFEAEKIVKLQKILSPSAYTADEDITVYHPSVATHPAGTPRKWWFVDPRSPHPLLRHPLHARKELLYRSYVDAACDYGYRATPRYLHVHADLEM